MFYFMSGVFFLSGAIALVYQVVWMRILSLFLGSDIYAASIVLCVFMGGLSLGSYTLGKWGDRFKNPLLFYGILEVIIGIYSYFIPDLLKYTEGFYNHIYQVHSASSPMAYNALRLLISALSILPPTLCMGGTFPLLIRQFGQEREKLDNSIRIFYSTNTFGALLGTLLSGLLLLPLFGISNSLVVGLVTNVTIGIMVIVFAIQNKNNSLPPVQAYPNEKPKLSFILGIATLTGCASIALEVVWMRVLIQSFSATVYAYTIMLACFLAGMAYGSARAKSWIKSNDRDILLGHLYRAESLLAMSTIFLGLAAYVVPSLFGNLIWRLNFLTHGAFGICSILAQFFVSGVLIIGPTILLGMIFPLTIKLYHSDISRRAQSTGYVYAANTIGAVIGALISGFVLLPTFGISGSIIAISIMFIVASLCALFPSKNKLDLSFPTLTLVGMIILLFLPYRPTLNYNTQRGHHSSQIIYHNDGVISSVDVIQNENGHLIMQMDGNIEADTTLTQRRHFILKAQLPLLLHDAPKDIAVIGLGLGITLSSLIKHPEMEKIKVIELNPEIVKMHSYLPKPLGEIIKNPKIDLRIDDGRSFLTHSKEQFDIITADPIHPRITRVGFLYTQEYYKGIKDHLRPGGIVAQWMPLYHISKKSLDVALKTFISVFPNSSFWYVRGHAVLIGRLDHSSISYEQFLKHFASSLTKEEFSSIDIHTPQQLLDCLLMDSEHLHQYIASAEPIPLNTDDNGYLEYHSPFEYLQGTEQLMPALIAHSGRNVNSVLNQTPLALLQSADLSFQKRVTNILDELKHPIN